MKRLICLLVLLTVAGFTKSSSGLTPVQDPAIVNSDTITLRLDNPRVRVLEAILKPGDKEKTHSHPAYVIYVIAGGKVRMHGTDGSVNEVEFKTGDVLYREAVTHWGENIGNTTIKLELVELKN